MVSGSHEGVLSDRFGGLRLFFSLRSFTNLHGGPKGPRNSAWRASRGAPDGQESRDLVRSAANALHRVVSTASDFGVIEVPYSIRRSYTLE